MNQKKKIEISRRSVLAGMGAFGFANFVKPRIVVSQDRSVLTIRSSVNIQTLDPAYYVLTPEREVINSIFTGLVSNSPGKEWKIRPGAATSIEPIDATSIGFTLRENIEFTDEFGQMTAEDVKFSFERVADPENGSPHSNDWVALLKVEVLDRFRGIIRLKFPYVPFVSTTLTSPSGSIISQSAIERSGGRFGTIPLGQTGKYFVSEFIPSRRIVLRRNPNWIGNQGEFDEIRIISIQSTISAEREFEIGEIDITRTNLSTYPRLIEYPPSEGILLNRPKLTFVWLGINQEFSPLDNIHIRRAIQFAINREEVVKEAYFGAAKTSTGIIPHGMLGNREKNLFNFNPAIAREIIEREGISNLNFTLDILKEPEMLRAARIIQKNLKDVGIVCRIISNNYHEFIKLGSNNNKIQLILNKRNISLDPSSATKFFTIDQIGYWNKENFNNKEFTELHRKGLSETDVSVRDNIYKRMQDLMEESASFVFLTNEVTTLLYRNSIIPALKPNGDLLLSDFRRAF